MKSVPFQVKKENGVAVISLEGELDREIGRLLFDEIIRLLEQGFRRLLLDMMEVLTVRSTGLGYLIFCVKRCERVGATLGLCRVPEGFESQLQFTATDSVLKVFPDAQSAIWD